MIKLTKDKLNQLLLGASLLSTGGGGCFSQAQKILKKITRPPLLASLEELKPADLTVTLLGVGDKDVCDPIACSNTSLKIFQKLFKKKVKAIVPIEIGPVSTLTAVFLASKLNLPLVDADIVGWRASPEIFLETITLAKLSREPIVMANDKNDTLILYRSSSLETMEKTLRDFAVTSGGDAYGIGYPLTIKQIKNVVGKYSLSGSILLGSNLTQLQKGKINLSQFCQINQLKMLNKGKIIKSDLKTKNGFIEGQYRLNNNLTVLVKNENIALLENNRPALTVPDSILIMDAKDFIGINNQDNNLNKNIIILGKKAIPLWRSKQGVALFSPKKLGYNIKQVLL